jgi:hypothetical protein
VIKIIVAFTLAFGLSYFFIEWFKQLSDENKVKFLKTSLYVGSISAVVIALLSVFVFLF